MAANEEPIPHTTDPVSEPKEAKSGDENPDAADSKPKKARAKKASSKPKKRNAPAHPTYLEMVQDVVTTLKERNGSSQYAI